MTQIGNAPAIFAVKEQLRALTAEGLISEWEIPYEHILTRLSAAIFFISASEDNRLSEIWERLSTSAMPRYRVNTEKKLSTLDWRVEFEENR